MAYHNYPVILSMENTMKKAILLIIFFPIFLIAQGENNNWLTGWGWINFNDTLEKPLFNYNPQDEFIHVNPVVSNFRGDLLFYTDGCEVFNTIHNKLLNGSYNNKYCSFSGSNSKGNLSTVIIPHRSDRNLYYIFQSTNDPFIKYCIIDMSLDNGMGKLILRDTIRTNHLIKNLATTANPNGRDAWLVAVGDGVENDAEFFIYSFLIDVDSIHTYPIISKHTIKYNSGKSENLIENLIWKSLRISKAGNCLGLTLLENYGYLLLRFNNNTGITSNCLEFFFNFTDDKYGSIRANEFSPDGKYLLFSRYIYDLSVWDTNSIRSSRKEYIASYKYNFCSDMQIGFNNLIYSLWIRDDIINNYDTAKVYIVNKLNEEIKVDSISLFIKDFSDSDIRTRTFFPPLVVPRLNYNTEILGDSIYCVGDTLRLQARIVQDSMKAERYRWNRSTLQDSVIEIGPLGINDGGWYTATCYYMDIPRTDSIFIKILPNPEFYIKSTDYSPCEGDTITLSASDNFKKYLWNDGDTNVTKTTTETGIYSLTVTNEAGCEGTMDIEINFGKAPELAILGDTIICPGNKAKLEAQSEPENQIKWSTGSNKNIIEVDSGSYWVMVISPAGCRKIDTIHVGYSPLTEVKIALEGNPVICKGNSIILKTDPESADYTYSWSNGETSTQIEIENGGYYWVEVTDENGCTGYSDTVEITEADPPNPVIAGATEFCTGERITLSTEKEFTSYQWSNGETTRNIEISTAGKYYVTVTDENGCTGADSIEINEIEIDISGFNNIDFGEINIGQEGSTGLIAVNNSNQTITIESIYFKRNLPEFTYKTALSLPNTFNPGENLIIDVKFIPNAEQYFADSLILEISEPCEVNKSISVTGEGGRSNARLLLTIPDLTGKVGDENFRIPLYANTENHTGIEGVALSGVISFKKDIYLPDSMINATITAMPIENSKRKVYFEARNVDIDHQKSIIAEISGKVLLGNTFVSTLELSDVILSEDMPIIIENGSLTADSLCVKDIRKIILFHNAEMSISPNPIDVQSKIYIKYSQPGKYILSIYTTEGRLTKGYEWHNSSNSKKAKTINPEFENYSNGLYRIVLQTPEGVISKGIIVLR